MEKLISSHDLYKNVDKLEEKLYDLVLALKFAIKDPEELSEAQKLYREFQEQYTSISNLIGLLKYQKKHLDL